MDSTHGRLFLRWIGQVAAPQLAALMREIEEDPEFRPGFDRICDLRRANIALPTAQLRDIVTIERALADRGCYRRTAVIVADDLSYGMMRMVTSLADLAETSYRIFDDPEAALAWLQVPGEEATPSFEDDRDA